VLSIEKLNQYYGGSHILRDVTFDVPDGSCTALMGRNGVGKTTLLKCLMGLLPIRSGTVSFDGRALGAMPPYARAALGVGYVPQGRDIFPRLTARENLLVSAYANRLDVDRRMRTVLEEFPGLVPRLDRLGGSLSGGEQQLLALARALLAEPKLLLLDEPSEGLQPSFVDLVGEKLVAIRERLGVAILLVEQNLDFAAQLAGRAYIVDVGQVRRELAPNELLEDPALQHEYMGG
jgi:urea transport system ATP-binding protein